MNLESVACDGIDDVGKDGEAYTARTPQQCILFKLIGLCEYDALGNTSPVIL